VFETLAQPGDLDFWRSLGREPAILSARDKSRQLSISSVFGLGFVFDNREYVQNLF